MAVQLLDSASGRVLKSWRFQGQTEIAIGRAPECEVEINDPYVSRLHAQLQFRDGRWNIVSHGRHGVLVRNEPITDQPLEADAVFQLGPTGPVLRFGADRTEQDCRGTLIMEVEPLPAFTLDEAKLGQEVEQIADGDYFQRLKLQAKTLRTGRSTSHNQPG